jgi:hypothetical protein
MFLGHYGVALALKRAEPKLSLGTLFMAVQLVDFLWGAFLLLGWERVRITPGYTAATPLEVLEYPISHSLVGMAAWSVAAAALYYSWPTRDTSRHFRAAVIVAVAVLSHYLLDLIVHVPDLPLAGQDSPKLGLGLWNNLGATLAAELLVFGAGLAIYIARRSPRHPIRPVRLTILTVFLVGIYLANVFGPVPTSVTGIAVAVLILYPTIALLAAWADA